MFFFSEGMWILSGLRTENLNFFGRNNQQDATLY